jgi:hypothetical protein
MNQQVQNPIAQPRNKVLINQPRRVNQKKRRIVERKPKRKRNLTFLPHHINHPSRILKD